MNILLLIIGFLLLIKGADILVDGASSIAKKYGISSLVIGLTIVAFGTSAPELVVNMLAAFSGNTDLAISNILGSNISNILLILGLTAMVYPIAMPVSTVRKEIPFVIFVSAVLVGLLSDGNLSRIDSSILGVLFLGFMYYTYKISKQKTGRENKKEKNEKFMSNTKSILFIIGGLAGLLIGGKLIVDSAVSIATNFGLPQSFIGVTVVAIGTSLPELAASMVAAFKKETDMAIGAIVGSNIFNTLWILGITGIINPLPGYENLNTDLMMNLIVSLAIFLAAFTFKKNFLTRGEGGVLLIGYIAYILYLVSTL